MISDLFPCFYGILYYDSAECREITGNRARGNSYCSTDISHGRKFNFGFLSLGLDSR